MNILQCAQFARNASYQMACLDTQTKNTAITAVAQALLQNRERIFAANQVDLEAGKALPTPVLKRLRFDEKKLQECIQGLYSLLELPDPVGRTLQATELNHGLELYRVTVPIGVIGIIFESRPDALIQIGSLCLKSGNATLMKGGSEALHTNQALTDVISNATKGILPANWLQLLETREDVNEMLKLDEYLDLIIPRGSGKLVKFIQQHSLIPVMGHAEGLCHTYVDSEADIEMAVNVTVDAKTQYVSVCNATETLLVHQSVAQAFLPQVAAALREKHVTLKGCPVTCQIIPDCLPATDEDWDTEYLDYVLSIKVVSSLQEAIAHINTHGSRHTEAIITRSAVNARTFMTKVDAADVFWNCSTRFADGYRFGLGAEVGIATSKIHARGPVGLEGLCTYKWMLCGNGDTVQAYVSGNKTFTHNQLQKTIQDNF